MKLTFNRDHASDLAIISKDKLLDCFKALLDKGLHIAWLLGLRQNLQQLIIGQEEEPVQAQQSECAERANENNNNNKNNNNYDSNEAFQLKMR